MRKLMFSVITLLAFSVMINAQKKETIEGNGKIVTRDVTVSSFDKLKASGIYELKLSQGNKESVKIEADENLQEYFTVRNEGSELVIEMKKLEDKNMNIHSKLRVYVTFTRLKELNLSTIGDVNSTGSLSFDDLVLKTKSVGNVDLKELKPADKQYYLQHVVAPRPICFASTIDIEGNVNLSPFSFFNLFSSNPPIVIFSPARRVRDNTTKHSLENVIAVPEVVINIVSYEMVQQTSLASCEYPKGVDEFTKAGFTKETAIMVKPPMVKESLAKLECKVLEVKSLGETGGAGQLVICEVLCMHIDDSVLTEDRKVNQEALDLVARLGADWYCRVTKESLFKVPKPNVQLGIGMDALPENIRTSKILNGNQLAQLANVHEMPVVMPSFDDEHLKNIIQYFSVNPTEMENELHSYAARLLDEGKVQEAWQVLLASEY